MARFVCIHGHFYQPPRDNPWLEAIEPQASAHPYRDWNARVTAECYAPNAASRILLGDGRIGSIVNNYARMSFDFGPTLLAWLETEEPKVYGAVLAADRASRKRFSGHGSAMAQAYHHVILPLANRRDKQTEIVWGLRDFEHRFGRPAAGMWLPETAVDLESLDLLAAHGVRYTVLEPHQARRTRPLLAAGRSEWTGRPRPAPAAVSREWRDAGGGQVDTTRPYAVDLPSGRRIAVFFYDGPISRAVAFDALLANGERLAGRLLEAVPGDGPDRLVHVATDGETYGHHHRHGEMALSYALRQLESNGWATLTNYGEYLDAHPPADEVEIVENSSWSCVHGVDRWREDCGCRIGGPADWNQAWRAPLRQALDELRDELMPLYEAAAGEIFASPWRARDDYVTVRLERLPANVDAFLERHAGGPVASGERRVRALSLLEMQRHAMLMYTSCGWFFDDLAGLEAVQVMRYAGRAAQLAAELFGGDFEGRLLRRLAWARSNDPQAGSGRDLYEARVRPSRVGPSQVAARYALRAPLADLAGTEVIHGHAVERRQGLTRHAGRSRLTTGRLCIRSLATGAADHFCFGALYDDHPHLTAGVRRATGSVCGSEGEAAGETAGGAAAGDSPLTPSAYERIVADLDDAFANGDVAQLVRLLDQHFEPAEHALGSTFCDEQRDALDLVLGTRLQEVDDRLREIYVQNAPWMHYLARAGSPLPAAFRAAADLVVNADLRRALANLEGEPSEIERRLAEALRLGVTLDAAGLGKALEQALVQLLERLSRDPGDSRRLAQAAGRAALARSAPFPVSFWRAQNLGHELRETAYAARLEAAAAGDRAAAAWVERFGELANALSLGLGE